MLSIKELVRGLPTEKVKASIYNILSALGIPTTAFQDGSVPKSVIITVATLFAGWTRVIAVLNASRFLELAEGIWLVILAKEVYGVIWLEATYATGELVLINTGGGLYSFDPGEVFFKNPANGQEYTNRDAFSIAPLGTTTITIRSLEAGSVGSAGPGEITEKSTSLAYVTVTNPSALIALDGEDDISLRQRCRDSLGLLSPHGPAAAYIYVAKSARRADGTPIGVTRVYVRPAAGDGHLYVYVATSSGVVAGTVGDESTDLGVIYRDILDKLGLSAIGVVLHLASATTLSVEKSVTVYVDSSFNILDAEWISSVATKIAAYYARVPIGGWIIPPPSTRRVPWRAIIGQIESIAGVLEAKLDDETDIDVLETEIPIHDVGTTITISQVSI